MPSKKLWAYISRLEKAIKQTLESSAEIAEFVAKIQAEGVEVSLNCIALFSDPKGRTFTSPAGKILKGKRRPAPKGKQKPASRKKDLVRPAPKLEINEKDREFLRSIGIRFD